VGELLQRRLAAAELRQHQEALETHRYCSEYVITRRVSYEVTETPEQAYERFEEGKEALRKLAAVPRPLDTAYRLDIDQDGRIRVLDERGPRP
jgi:hypothetical protein